MVNNERIRIAVVGGGIAGITLALALARGGLRCQVFEQTPIFDEIGAGVQLAPNATRLLHRLGLGDRLREVAVPVQAIEMRRWDDNSVLYRAQLGAECERRFGAPYYTVHRAHLHRCLLERLREGILHLGLACTNVEERSDEMHLQFAEGASATADVVLGADGIHSRLRELVIRDRPRYSGQCIYRALIPAERVPFLCTEPKIVLWLGPERHCVAYPVSGCRAVSLAATVPHTQWNAESWSAQGRVEDLAEAYADWHPEVRALTSAPDTVRRWALHDREWLPRWSTERTTLVGDAAHPMLPFLAQGANQAIEDAVVLAACLRSTGTSGISSITDALVRFEQIRQPRTGEVQRISRENAVALHLPDGAEQRSRDQALAARSGLAHQEWIYGYDAEAEVTR